MSELLYNQTRSNALNLFPHNCPFCNTRTQFKQNGSTSSKDTHHHFISCQCSVCSGLVVFAVMGNLTGGRLTVLKSFPASPKWNPRVALSLISDEGVRSDFEEAINCFNFGSNNGAMVIARRAIHREMIKRGLDKKHPGNLFQQIEATGISTKLKQLLQKVKNFGNHGAHPDFCLYDDKGNELDNPEKFAELTLNFLDKYFADEYETDDMIQSAPSSAKELEI